MLHMFWSVKQTIHSINPGLPPLSPVHFIAGTLRPPRVPHTRSRGTAARRPGLWNAERIGSAARSRDVDALVLLVLAHTLEIGKQQCALLLEHLHGCKGQAELVDVFLLDFLQPLGIEDALMHESIEGNSVCKSRHSFSQGI